MDREPFADDVLDPHPRVEGADGVLEDDLHVAPRRLELGPGELRDQVGPSKLDLAGGRLEQADQRPPERRLAAARLADEPERLAPPDLEVDAVDGLDVAGRPPQQPVMNREVLADAAGLEEHVARAGAEALAPGQPSYARQLRGRAVALAVLAEPAGRTARVRL